MVYQSIKKSIFISFLVISIGFFSGRAYLLHKKKRKLDSIVSIVQRPIKVIVQSDNQKVLRSAVSQDYDNFEVLQLNKIKRTASDGTLKKQIVATLEKLDPNDIVVLVDGSRIFAHDHVLSKINQVYNSEDALALGCNQLSYPNYDIQKENNIYCFLAKAVLNSRVDIRSEDVKEVDDIFFLVSQEEF